MGVLCAPHAATHVPLARRVTQRRQAFWQSVTPCAHAVGSVIWSLVRSTVSQSSPVASIGGCFIRGRPRAMTPKIARFLAAHQPATPCLVLDVDRVEANYRSL